MQVTIERMTGDDVEAVMAIDRLSFPTPWSENAYRSELGNVCAFYLVARTLGAEGRTGADLSASVVGYAGGWMVMDEAHITTLGVHPEFRRQGIGARLLSALLGEAAARGVRRATLEVRESNLSAQSLYARFGFAPIARRRQYYTDTGEDAIIMWVENLKPGVQVFRRSGVQVFSECPNVRTPERLNT